MKTYFVLWLLFTTPTVFSAEEYPVKLRFEIVDSTGFPWPVPTYARGSINGTISFPPTENPPGLVMVVRGDAYAIADAALVVNQKSPYLELTLDNLLPRLGWPDGTNPEYGAYYAKFTTSAVPVEVATIKRIVEKTQGLPFDIFVKVVLSDAQDLTGLPTRIESIYLIPSDESKEATRNLSPFAALGKDQIFLADAEKILGQFASSRSRCSVHLSWLGKLKSWLRKKR